MKLTVAGILIVLLGCVHFGQVESTNTWDPCDNVFKLYKDCFSSDRERLNKACAFGTNEKFLEGLKKGSLTCRSKFDELKKKNGNEIKVGDPCGNIDKKLKDCFSSDRSSLQKACKDKSPEDIGKAYIGFTLTCRSALEKAK